MLLFMGIILLHLRQFAGGDGRMRSKFNLGFPFSQAPGTNDAEAQEFGDGQECRFSWRVHREIGPMRKVSHLYGGKGRGEFIPIPIHPTKRQFPPNWPFSCSSHSFLPSIHWSSSYHHLISFTDDGAVSNSGSRQRGKHCSWLSGKRAPQSNRKVWKGRGRWQLIHAPILAGHHNE